MRKYFLLSFAALMAATSANATTDYAEVTAKATIEVAGTFSCDPIDFGTIVLKQGNGEIILHGLDGAVEGDKASLLSPSEYQSFLAECSFVANENIDQGNFNLPETIQLTGEDPNNKISMKNTNAYPTSEGYTYVTGSLYIPADAEADTYNGTFTMSVTY
ncbi:MAG: DUF4402 domain-containing protein [Alphaproteobacteria bacterium]|nr:DUF4402 domain-containing protein [Alphaproteobacteria bacterium]